MASFESRMKAMTNRLIVKRGEQMTLERKTNTGTSVRPTMTTATSTVTAFIDNINLRDFGSQVQTTRQFAYIAPNATTEPLPNDILEDADGKRFEIVGASPIKVSGTVVLYQADIGTA